MILQTLQQPAAFSLLKTQQKPLHLALLTPQVERQSQRLRLRRSAVLSLRRKLLEGEGALEETEEELRAFWEGKEDEKRINYYYHFFAILSIFNFALNFG